MSNVLSLDPHTLCNIPVSDYMSAYPTGGKEIISQRQLHNS